MTSTIALIERAKAAARLFYANAEGCAVNHYGEDFATHGAPGWMTDAKADIDAAMAELTTLLKRCDYWEKQYNEARALAWKTADERDALLERCEKAEAELRDEIKIVDRVWSALGISTYEQAGGKEISEIVADWKERAETSEAQVKKLTAERDALKTALKIYGAHANECSGRYGPECNCGWRELKI